MEIIKAIVLGIVQGLTEYLPISSTAHLRIVPALFGWEDPGAGFSAVIQLGTMLAVIIYFWKDLIVIFNSTIKDLFKLKFNTSQETKLGWYIIIGTIPISIVGLLGKDFIETGARSLYLIAFNLIFFAILLWISEKVAKQKIEINNLNFSKAMIMSIAQVFSLIPGASRSGVTITGGLFAGLTREAAARFSFLLSVPAILLSGLYQFFKIFKTLSDENYLALIIGTVVSFIFGYLSIAFLLNYLKKNSTLIFIVYRLVIGIFIFILLYLNLLK